MNKIFTIASISLLMLGACSKPEITVSMENNSPIARSNETIEIQWSAIAKSLPQATPATVIVLDQGKQIVSQVLFTDGDSLKPRALIFQSSIEANGKEQVEIATGIKEEYPSMAYSRFVPERKDDYAWENNLVAQRVYGKALENELQSPGVDVWSKRVPDLVIDTWYKIDNYHHDNGQGMDNYKVGNTLGGGCSAPIADSQIVLSRNMIEWKRTANGPIRTEFTLSYAPFMVDSTEVVMQKTYSLDANTRFTKVTDIYNGDFKEMPVGVGFIVHSPEAPFDAQGKMMAIYEPVSDGDPKVGGEIGVAVVAPEANTQAQNISGHKLLEGKVEAGKPSHYYVGSSWSKGGMPTAQEWFDYCRTFEQTSQTPITVTLN